MQIGEKEASAGSVIVDPHVCYEFGSYQVSVAKSGSASQWQLGVQTGFQFEPDIELWLQYDFYNTLSFSSASSTAYTVSGSAYQIRLGYVGFAGMRLGIAGTLHSYYTLTQLKQEVILNDLDSKVSQKDVLFMFSVSLGKWLSNE